MCAFRSTYSCFSVYLCCSIFLLFILYPSFFHFIWRCFIHSLSIHVHYNMYLYIYGVYLQKIVCTGTSPVYLNVRFSMCLSFFGANERILHMRDFYTHATHHEWNTWRKNTLNIHRERDREKRNTVAAPTTTKHQEQQQYQRRSRSKLASAHHCSMFIEY